MKQYKFGLILLFLLTLNNCGFEDSKQLSYNGNLEEIKLLADAYLDGLDYFFPEQTDYYNLKESNLSRLNDNSASGNRSWMLFEDSIYNEFKKLSARHEIGNEAWYIYGILKEVLEASIDIRICRGELMKISHIHGWQVSMPGLISTQPVGSPEARSSAIKRWSGLSKYVDNEIYNLRLGIKLGYTVPKGIVSIVISQLDDLLMEPVESSEFYNPAIRDTDNVFIKKWRDLVANIVYPAVKKYQDFLIYEYYPGARESISIIDLPQGAKCFEAYFRYQTSLKRNVEDIYTIAEYNAKINDSKLRIVGRSNFNTDSIPQIIQAIQSDTAEYFNSKKEVLKFVITTIERAEKKCSLYFNRLPVSKVEVKPIPEKDEDHQSSYFVPSIDDSSDSSVFYVNLRNSQKRLRGNVETETFHETYPGHHVQLALSVENKNIHPISKLFTMNGFIEGWAGYAQILAEEMGLYTSSYSRLLVLGRSSRILYVEACVNTKQWTRKQAVDYLIKTGSVSTEEIANQIINRMIVWPGQYSTYDTGLIEFLELREQAMLTLGDKFDIKEFHSIVLEHGAIPLEMLREKVNWWLEKKKE